MPGPQSTSYKGPRGTDPIVPTWMRNDYSPPAWLCPECMCELNYSDGVTSCCNCGWNEEDE